MKTTRELIEDYVHLRDEVLVSLGREVLHRLRHLNPEWKVWRMDVHEIDTNSITIVYENREDGGIVLSQIAWEDLFYTYKNI